MDRGFLRFKSRPEPAELAVPVGLNAPVAAHRFGLGEPNLAVVGVDPVAWLMAQIGPADRPWGPGLADTQQALQALAKGREQRRDQQRAQAMADSDASTAPQVGASTSASMNEGLPEAGPVANWPGTESRNGGLEANAERQLITRDLHSRMMTAVLTKRPFAERLTWFWSNHFTVSLLKGSAQGLVGAFEREAIRPHIAGKFEDLLWASTTHTAMLRYLDNHLSMGPDSEAAQRRKRMALRGQGTAAKLPSGLNENLARELLELHTLGAQSARNGVYTQADVTALAAVLTGWHGQVRKDGRFAGRALQVFEPSWHQPGSKKVLGRSYPAGPEGLKQIIRDLATHPQTARFVSSQLARHFVADEPPEPLVSALSARFQDSGGDLSEVYRALLAHPLAWSAEPAKLKTPEEFVVSAARMLGASRFAGSDREARTLVASSVAMGQRPHSAPSPAGWSDRFEDWMGPDAIWKRLEWAVQAGEKFASTVDARQLAKQSLGPRLSASSLKEIERAADAAQAIALLLMAPEFQRR